MSKAPLPTDTRESMATPAGKLGRRQVLGGLAWVASVPALACGEGSEPSASVGGPSDAGRASGASSDVPASGAARDAAAAPSESASEATQNPDTPLQAPPEWSDVPTCSASRTDGAGQGPFFIHDAERSDDVSLFRQDIRGRYDASAEPGIDMKLDVRILDATSAACNATPVAGVEVYIWHTDGQGYYSGFGDPGDQTPDEPYAGVPGQNDLKNTDRFCRGVQVTDANGVVSFRSIYPGWYNGRDLHIHVLVLRPGSAARGRTVYSGGDHVFTTQFYFDPAFTDTVHRSTEPYLRRTRLPAYQGAIQADEPNNSGLHAKASFDGSLVVAQMQVLLDPGSSRG
jgi:protocatechuate 3,4-dioxygenase beta subunit